MSRLAALVALLAAGCGARSGLIEDPVDAAVPGEDAAPPECTKDEDCFDEVFCNGEERCIGGACYPGLPERCSDGDLCTEDVCDVALDECSHESLRVDLDGDGFHPTPCGPDCDDEDALVYPGAPERCNGKDDDCDEEIDEDLVYSPTRVETRVTEDPDANFGWGVVWADDRWIGSHYDQMDPSVYLTLLDPDGRRIESMGDDIDMSLHPGDAYGAGLAWSGRVLGAVWEDRRDGDYEIYFQRLNEDGDKLQPDLRITYAPEFSINPSMTWTGEEFAMVWQDSRFWGIELDNDEIFLQRVSEDGDPIGLEIQVTDSIEPSLNPSVAWSGEEWAVVWVELLSESNHEIFFRRVSAEGEGIGNPVRLTDDPGESTSPSVVWADGEWAIAWEENEGTCAGASTRVQGACFMRVSTEGGVLQERRVDDGTSYARFAGLRWAGGQYLAWWSDWRHGQFEIYYVMLDRDGENILSDTRITEAAGDSIASSTAQGEGDIGMLFTDTRHGDYEVYFTTLSCGEGPSVD